MKLECDKREHIESEGINMVVNKENPEQVCVMITDMVRACLKMKCEKYDNCHVHEALLEVLKMR